MLLLVSKLFRAMKLLGPLSGLLYVIDQKLIRTDSNSRVFYYDIMIQPVRDQPMLPVNRGRSISIRAISEGDPVLTDIPPTKLVVSLRFKQDAICLGAFQNGDLIGYLWLAFDGYEEDEVRATFRPQPPQHTAFDFDVYMFPEHRFGFGFAALWDGANEYMSQRQIRYTCSRVSRFNPESRRSHKRLDSTSVGRSIFLRGKNNQLMLSTLRPFVHFSRNSHSRPTVDIHVPR